MSTMTITITEDAEHVYVDFDLDGYDIDAVTDDGDLPAALQLGASMVRHGDELAMPKSVQRI